MSPWMSNQERSLIEDNLNKDHIMLEWGSGGSTISFAPLVKKIYSIEHDPAWFRKVDSLKANNVDYFLVESNRGRSADDTPKEDFIDYINKVDDLNVDRFDVVFIDGRARKYCAEKVLKYIDENSLVFIHDFERPRYRNYVKDFLDIAEERQRMALLKKRKTGVKNK